MNSEYFLEEKFSNQSNIRWSNNDFLQKELLQ